MRRRYKSDINVPDTSHRNAIIATEFQNRPLIRYDYRSELAGIDMREIYLSPTAFITCSFLQCAVEIAHVDYFVLPQVLRGHSLGKRLFQAMVLTAKEYGAHTLHSDEVSNDALNVRWSLFGYDSQEFYDSDNPDAGYLPLTLEQAKLTNNLIEDSWQPLGADDFRLSKLGVNLDLDSVDTSTWQPIEMIVRTADPHA